VLIPEAITAATAIRNITLGASQRIGTNPNNRTSFVFMSLPS
jgi:hypothetical protein